MHSPTRQDSTCAQPHRTGQLRHPLQLRAGRLLGQGQAGRTLHWDSSGMITQRQRWHLRSRDKRSGITGGSLTCQPLSPRPCAYCSVAVSSQGDACILGRDSPRRCSRPPPGADSGPGICSAAAEAPVPHGTALPDEVTGVATLRNLSMMVSIGFRYGAEEAASPAATHQIYPQSYCSLQLIAELETIRELPNYCQLERANQAPITHTHAAAALTIKCQISLETSNKIKSLTFNFSSTHSAGFQSA